MIIKNEFFKIYEISIYFFFAPHPDFFAGSFAAAVFEDFVSVFFVSFILFSLL